MSGHGFSEALPQARVTVRTNDPLNKRRAPAPSWHNGALHKPHLVEFWLLLGGGGWGGGYSGNTSAVVSVHLQSSSVWSPAGQGTTRLSVPDPGTLPIPCEVQLYKFSPCYDLGLILLSLRMCPQFFIHQQVRVGGCEVSSRFGNLNSLSLPGPFPRPQRGASEGIACHTASFFCRSALL